MLAGLLGRPVPPTFLHHRLTRDEIGAKLSKRDGSPALARLRADGQSPEAVWGLAAQLTGLQETPASTGAGELGAGAGAVAVAGPELRTLDRLSEAGAWRTAGLWNNWTG